MSINECREIYREAFGSDGEFENRLFTCCFKYCRTLSIGGKTASMLFALHCNIHSDAAPVSAYYIFAAATKKEFRGNGYMSRLIRSLEADRLLFLKPASPSLFGFYERLGFQPFSVSSNENSPCFAEPAEGFAALADKEEKAPISCTALFKYDRNILIDGLFFPFFME